MPSGPQNGGQGQMMAQQQVQQAQQVQQTQQAQQVDLVQHNPASYQQPLMAPNLKAHQTPYMKKQKLNSVRAAVLSTISDAYDAIDQFQANPADQLRVSPLHHSRGAALLGTDPKTRVLEFDIAGSGFKQFRSDYMGIKGKGTSLKSYMKLSGAAKFFSWLPSVKRHYQAKAKQTAKAHLAQLQNNTLQRDKLTDAEQQNLQALIRWQNRFGKSQSLPIDGKKQKRTHIRMVEHDNKTRITMAGPLKAHGMRNKGEYSIENLSQYILTMGQQYLTQVFAIWDNGHPPTDVWLRFRGHSRGAVASMEGAMLLRHWVREHFYRYQQFVLFDVTQFDPVPGAGSYDDHARVDVRYNNLPQYGKGMEALGPSAETTVVYSMLTEHKHFFTPQQVMNTKRVILMPYAHSVSLGESEQSGDASQTKHRPAFTDAATLDAYHAGSFNELPEGVYVVDENRTLVRLQTAAQWDAIRNNIMEHRATAQKGRAEVLTKVVRAWFASHPQPNPAANAPGNAPGGN